MFFFFISPRNIIPKSLLNTCPVFFLYVLVSTCVLNKGTGGTFFEGRTLTVHPLKAIRSARKVLSKQVLLWPNYERWIDV